MNELWWLFWFEILMEDWQVTWVSSRCIVWFIIIIISLTHFSIFPPMCNSRARNIMLGLGDTVLRMYIVDPTFDHKPLNIVTLTITRTDRQPARRRTDKLITGTTEKLCGLKQVCTFIPQNASHIPTTKRIQPFSSLNYRKTNTTIPNMKIHMY